MRSIVTLLLVFAATAAADVLHLKDGRSLSGKVSLDAGRYTVVDRDRKFVVAAAEVQSVEPGQSFMDEYEARFSALRPDDAEGIFEFGRWLEENDWASRARRAYEEVLGLDPDHRGARRALGYKLFEGEWISQEEMNRRNGLVEYEGGWYTPHDLAELQKEIEGNEQLRAGLSHRKQVNRKVNEISRRFATFDKKERQKAYDDLYSYAEQLNSPELRKFADDAKAYYDYMAKVLCARMMAQVEVQATLTRLKKPIDVFETSLGQAIGPLGGQNAVKIQLPELSVVRIQTTADIPAGCR